MSKIIELEALDTLFFRDGKPFSMGDESWADGVFPPFPSVIYGALRTAYFAEDIKRFRDIGHETKSAELSIHNFFYKIDSCIYYPMPLDLVEITEKGEEDKWLGKMRLEPQSGVLWNNPFLQVLNFESQNENQTIETLENCLINSMDLQAYLSGKNDDELRYADYERVENMVLSEPKVGIGLNKCSGSSDESRLYRVGMRRLDSKSGRLSIGVSCKFDDLETIPEMIRLGGEGKSARSFSIEDAKVIKDIKIPQPTLSGTSFKLYLSTPAIFQHDWKPVWMKEDGYFDYSGVRMKLLAAAVGKPCYIGGFDMKNKCPKKMQKAAPAGSVYYLELEDVGDGEKIPGLFHNKSISEINEFVKQGFGITFVGEV